MTDPIFSNQSRITWRDYQEQLRKEEQARKKIRSYASLITVLICIIMLAYYFGWETAGFIKATRFYKKLKETPVAKHGEPAESEEKPKGESVLYEVPEKYAFVKKDFHSFLKNKNFSSLQQKNLDIVSGANNFRAITTIDMSLQNYIQSILDTDNARHIGIVAMDPDSGRILSMVGYNREDPDLNSCTEVGFPAASIFKFITAAGAVEDLGLKAESAMRYNGRNHTLYKSQMKKTDNKYTKTLSLKASFGKSINPIFGKIGYYDLKKDGLYNHAMAFGFNSPINFEIPLSESKIVIDDSPFNWAEIASGFNRKTTITPVHGALLISTLFNEGELLEPTLIDSMFDGHGRVVYRAHKETIRKAMESDTVREMKKMMEATISAGTCKKSFRGYNKDRILSKLNIGGKTGSIDNNDHEERLDWFIGYGEEKNGGGKIVVSVVVGHVKFMGTRASQYGKKTMRYYFEHLFAERGNGKKESKG